MQGQEASALLLAQTRHYFSPISVEFSEDVAGGPKVSICRKQLPHMLREQLVLLPTPALLSCIAHAAPAPTAVAAGVCWQFRCN
jgi:hypothetical protein